MGTKTGIEWTDATWNPLRGCSRVSEGCRHCYAEKVAYRFSGPGKPYEGLAILRNGHASWTGKVEFVEKHLLDPLKWKEPRKIFVNSMSDLFHEIVPAEWLDRIFAVMAVCPWHTFQVLTKRPERMRNYCSSDDSLGRILVRAKDILAEFGFRLSLDILDIRDGMGGFQLPNVWLGTSVENQDAADNRVPVLIRTPSAVRFVSCEPLLGSVDLRSIHLPGSNDFTAHECQLDTFSSLIKGRPLLDWVICGGESGPDARPMNPNWARSIRDQCVAAGVPFFFKQWGEWGDSGIISRSVPCFSFPPHVWRVGKHAAGALLDGREWRQFPEVRG